MLTLLLMYDRFITTYFIFYFKTFYYTVLIVYINVTQWRNQGGGELGARAPLLGQPKQKKS